MIIQSQGDLQPILLYTFDLFRTKLHTRNMICISDGAPHRPDAVLENMFRVSLPVFDATKSEAIRQIQNTVSALRIDPFTKQIQTIRAPVELCVERASANSIVELQKTFSMYSLGAHIARRIQGRGVDCKNTVVMHARQLYNLYHWDVMHDPSPLVHGFQCLDKFFLGPGLLIPVKVNCRLVQPWFNMQKFIVDVCGTDDLPRIQRVLTTIHGHHPRFTEYHQT